MTVGRWTAVIRCAYRAARSRWCGALVVSIATSAAPSTVEAASLPAVAVRALVVDSTNAQIVYAGTSIGIYRTTDGGANWNRVDSGLTYTNVLALAIDPHDACRIYAGIDSGVSNIQISPSQIQIQNTNGILVASFDCGVTWGVPISAPFGRTIRSLAFTQSNPAALYASMTVNAVSGGFSTAQHRIARIRPGTTDFFFTFDDFNYVLAADPASPCTVYTGALSGRVLRNVSCDVVSWASVGVPFTASGKPTQVNTIAVHPTNGTTLLAGTGAGVIFRKVDELSPWVPVASIAGSVNAIAYKPGNALVAYAGGSGGVVHRTVDGGATWAPTTTIGLAIAAVAAGGVPSAFRAYVGGNSFVTEIASAGTPSPLSFTDASLTAGVTIVKGVHITELRQRVDGARVTCGLAAASWSDPLLAASAAPVRAVHITELRTAVVAAYVACGRVAPVFTDVALIPQVTPIRAVHIVELRSAVIALE